LTPPNPPQRGGLSKVWFLKPPFAEVWRGYLTNPAATPPSTLMTLPVDLANKPPVKAKHALAMSTGKII